MKGEKGNENEVWFLKDRNIPSLTINFDKHSNPCLWWNGRERENDVQTLSLMKLDKRTWKWLCVLEWDEWRHMWMRMSGFQEWEIETREWETTNRDESEIEWHKWWRERQDIHGGVECLYDVFECWYFDQTWDVWRLMLKQTLWNIIQTLIVFLWNEKHIIVRIPSQNACFVSCPVVSIQTDNYGNDEIGTMMTSYELCEWGMRMNECGVMMWFVLWPPCWPDIIQIVELEFNECWWCFAGKMWREITLIYQILW